MDDLPIRHIAIGCASWVENGGWSKRPPSASAVRLQRKLDAEAAAGTLQFPPENAVRSMRFGFPCRIVLWDWEENFKARAERARTGRAKKRKRF